MTDMQDEDSITNNCVDHAVRFEEKLPQLKIRKQIVFSCIAAPVRMGFGVMRSPSSVLHLAPHLTLTVLQIQLGASSIKCTHHEDCWVVAGLG